MVVVRAAQAAGSVEEAAEAATQPFFDTNSLQLQPAYTHFHAGGFSDQVLLRLVLAYKGILVPGFKYADIYSVARLEMYGASLSPSNVVGLQNWNGLMLAVKPYGWGAQLALGVYSVFPTATNAALDAQEFQLGPAFGAMITHVRHLQIGFLGEFFFSVAGSTPGLAIAQLQPIIVYQLPKAFFFKSDGIMQFNLRSSPYATVPVNLHFGRGFLPHLVLSAIVEGVTYGSGVGNFTLRLNLNYLAW